MPEWALPMTQVGRRSLAQRRCDMNVHTRCQPEKVYRLAAHGELPSYKVQGRRLFDHDEVARWLEGRRDGERFEARGAA